MWLDPVGLEQATSEPVARHKARRLNEGVVFDVCSGVGGDSVAMASAGARVVSIDRSRERLRRTFWNARVYGVETAILPVRSMAESLAMPQSARVHIDPDRRIGRDRRARAVADYSPGLPFLRSLVNSARGGAIKLGPASDFSVFFDPLRTEIELISLGGECKEATVWFGDRATGRRRATALPSGASWTDRDGPDSPAAVGPLASCIFDPDPALVRSGLLDGFAVVHGLARFAPGIDLLTGPGPVRSPWLAAFEVLDVLPMDLKRLRKSLGNRGIGEVEIKPRGVDVRPETLRKSLGLEGEIRAALFPIGGDGPRRAILARRTDFAASPPCPESPGLAD